MADSVISRPAYFALRHSYLPIVTGYVVSVAMSAFSTLVNWPISIYYGQTSILLVYLLGVCLVAAAYGLGPSLLEAACSMAAFAYFYAPPLFSLAIADPENIAASAIMLLVAVVTSTLMAKVKSQARVASQREQRATELYQLSQALASARTEQEVTKDALRHIQSLHKQVVLVLADSSGALRRNNCIPSSLVWKVASEVIGQRGPVRNSERSETGLEVVGLPLNAGETYLGVLVVEDEGHRLLTGSEHRQHLDVLVSMVAQTIQRLRLAEQARESSIQAETEAVRNSLLSAISHDLRTPLTAIVGAAGTLLENEPTLDRNQRLELIRTIQDEANGMCDLSDKILDMARLSAGGLHLQKDWNVLEEIIGSTLNRIHAPLLGRSVNIQLSDTAPLVYVDAILLQQVLINLLDNAAKYSQPDTPIDIHASFASNGLTLSVADRGPGLSAESRGRVFDKFFRVNPECNPGGVGLGLAICRAIVEAHGGDLYVENRVGGGSIFSLYLPQEDVCPMDIPEDIQETST